MEQGQSSTIARTIECHGIGLHTGARASLRIEPATAGGRVFIDAEGHEIPASSDCVRSSARATALECGGARIATVEHLLATLYALEIDHVRIFVSGPEVPAFDGSAAPIVEWLGAAGRTSLPAIRTPIVLAAPVEVREGDRWVRAEPSSRLCLEYSIDFDHPLIRRQSVIVDGLDAKTFERELAPARTFGFLYEVEALRQQGLGLGGDLENAVILDDVGCVNEGALRFPDEFVRHKAIDLLGDLSLLGAPLLATVRVEKGGHRLHHRLVEAILEATGR